eukprot:51201_1
MWEELTIKTTQIMREYPYALPITKLIFSLHDTIPPGIPEKHEVHDEDKMAKDYTKSSNLMWPIGMAPFWFPWAFVVYKLHKREGPQLALTKKEMIGLGISFLGILIRNLSKLWIGHSFAYVLSIRKKQSLITSGPYSIVRHPGYTGTFLWLWGDAMYWNNMFSYGWAAFFSLNLIRERIPCEERMLATAFQDQWEKYTQNVKNKMIPFVY